MSVAERTKDICLMHQDLHFGDLDHAHCTFAWDYSREELERSLFLKVVLYLGTGSLGGGGSGAEEEKNFMCAFLPGRPCTE